MALGTDQITTTIAATFIPELWSDEVLAAYMKELVVANTVRKLNHIGKKGDTINVPKPVRGSANDKAANTQVVLNASAAGNLAILINKHKEYSYVIEDIVDVQALDSLRQFYTADAGYAIASAVEADLFALGATAQSGTAYDAAVAAGDGSTAWDGSASTDTGNGSVITDAGIRKANQTLDDQSVPQTDRQLIIPPVGKSALLAITRFSSSDFTSGMQVQTGQIGDIYGVDVLQSVNCVTLTADDSSTTYRVGILKQRDSWVHAEQLSIRTQGQYIQQYLGNLFTADTIYGVKEMRSEAVIGLVMPS